MNVEAGTRYEYWCHGPTRQLWAVKLLNGRPVGVCGPLFRQDASVELLPHLPYLVAEVGWIIRRKSEFTSEDTFQPN